MRPVRAAVHTALPLLALASLAVMSAVRGAPPGLALASNGGGSLAPATAGRVVTDGHPTPIVVPSPASVPAVTAPQGPATRSAPRAAMRPRQVPGAAPSAVPGPHTTTTDAYPYGADTTGGSDEWGFTKRQCVSYVAWRLAELGRPIDNASQGWGSALNWDDTARHLGYAVSTRPHVGAIAQWNAHESGPYWSPGAPRPSGTYVAGEVGHVAWVVSVYSDGSVLVAQYNGTGDRTYSTMRVTAPRYLSL